MPNTLDTNSTQDVAAMPKLDTVLFHFFEKIADIVLDARLPSPTSLEESDLELANELLYSLDDGSREKQAQEERSNANSWFDVQVPRAEYFAEELQLWRHLSALRDEQLSQFEQQPVQLPEMVLDILLDTSESSEQGGQNGVQHVLIRTLSDGRRTLIASNRTRGGVEDIDPSPPRKPFMLERWKISLDPAHSPSTTTDLAETFQKLSGCARSARHLASRLPSSILQRRIATQKSITGTAPKLRLGAQISAEEPSTDGARIAGAPDLSFTVPELEVDLEEFLHAQVRLAVPGKAESKGQDVSRRQSQKHSLESAIGVHELPSVSTDLGELRVSVHYQKEAQHSLESLVQLKSERERALEEMIMMDEDYFRFKPTVQQQQASGADDMESQAVAAVETRPVSPVRPTGHGAAISAQPTGQLKRHPSITSLQASSSLQGSSTPPSAFSSSGQRPQAGLSSLRGGPIPIPAAKSPAVAAALSSSPEPAFLAGPRRSAASPASSGSPALAPSGALLGLGGAPSDRQLRCLSNRSSDRPSPPSPTTLSISPSLSRQPSLRSTASGAAYGGVGSLRSGSYSPSSPSPLAQQVTSSGQLAAGAHSGRASLGSPAAGSYGRKPISGRSLELSHTQASGFPSLRSIFTTYDVGSVRQGSGSLPARMASGQNSPARMQSSGEGSLSGSRPLPTVQPQAIVLRPPPSHRGSFSYSWASASDAQPSHRQGLLGARSSESDTNAMGASVDDDLNNLVRWIDTRASLGGAPRRSASTSKALSSPASLEPTSGHAHVDSSNQPISRQRIDSMLSKMFADVGRSSPSSGGSTGHGGSSPSPTLLGPVAAGSPSTQRSPLSQPPFSAKNVARPTLDTSRGQHTASDASPHPIATNVGERIPEDAGSGEASLLDEPHSPEQGKSSLTVAREYEETTGALELTNEDLDSPEARRQREEQTRADAEMSSRFTRDLGTTRGQSHRHPPLRSRSPYDAFVNRY